jgi:hypothetical protein
VIACVPFSEDNATKTKLCEPIVRKTKKKRQKKIGDLSTTSAHCTGTYKEIYFVLDILIGQLVRFVRVRTMFFPIPGTRFTCLKVKVNAAFRIQRTVPCEEMLVTIQNFLLCMHCTGTVPGTYFLVAITISSSLELRRSGDSHRTKC